MSREPRSAASEPAVFDEEFWELRLYVAGQTPNCVKAFENLRNICERELKGRYRIEVIDLLEHPDLAKGDQILAVPTLVRKLPPPVKKIIGSLQHRERVLVGLDIRKKLDEGRGSRHDGRT